MQGISSKIYKKLIFILTFIIYTEHNINIIVGCFLQNRKVVFLMLKLQKMAIA